MEDKRGFEGKLYWMSAGSWANPTWTEIDEVRDLTNNDPTDEYDNSSRASGGFKTTGLGLKAVSMEFEIPEDPSVAGYTALETAKQDRSQIVIACCNGDIDAAGTRGFKASCVVPQFSLNQPLSGGQTRKVLLKPGRSANAPTEFIVAAS